MFWGICLDADKTGKKGSTSMWPGLDPKLLSELATVRQLVRLTHQTPVREWPLQVIPEQDVLFVVREWPDGSITAYTMDIPDRPRA